MNTDPLPIHTVRLAVVCWVWLVAGLAVRAQNLYVFLIADSTKKANKPNVKILEQLTTRLQTTSDYTLRWHDFGSASAFSRQSVLRTFTTFQPASAERDVIWLHLSGDGYGTGEKAWPTLRLRQGEVAVRELLAILRTKPVRTLLVTVDCDNRPRSAMSRLFSGKKNQTDTATGVLVSGILVKPNQKSRTSIIALPRQGIGFRTLFMPAQVQQIIVMAAADYGQRASQRRNGESAWFSAFGLALGEGLGGQTSLKTWKQIQERVVQLTALSIPNHQTPTYNRQTITCCESETK